MTHLLKCELLKSVVLPPPFFLELSICHLELLIIYMQIKEITLETFIFLECTTQ